MLMVQNLFVLICFARAIICFTSHHFHGHHAAAGSTPIHSAKVKWADNSKNSISFVSESETTVQFGSRNGEDTASIHESDLEMKHSNVDEHAS